MSSGDTSLMSSSVESPLDLTVKARLDLHEQANEDMDQYEYERYAATYANTGEVQMNSEYTYEQYPHTSPPDVGYQYNSSYCSNNEYSQRHIYPNPHLPNTSFTSQTGTYSPTNVTCQPDRDGLESMDAYHSFETMPQSQSPSYDSSIIPKKRKNLWRPYDSKLAQCNEAEKESDSGSDSTSGSSSDPEFKTPSPPSDPVKKRKTHRSNSNKQESNSNDNPVKSGNLDCPDGILRHTSVNQIDIPAGPNNSDWCIRPAYSETTSPNPSKTANIHQVNTAQQRSAAGNHHSKLISGMKKRDIFGWSLKLKNPAVSEDDTIKETDSSQKAEQTVCTDGEKTYTELQTVKKSSSEPSIGQSIRGESKPARSQSPRSGVSPPVSEKHKNKQQNNNKSVTDAVVNDVAYEKTDSDNYVGKKVYIQHKDNIIQCCNEAESKTTNGTTETKKRLSLIDLVEEIEATARNKDNEEVEKAHQRNRNIAKLLDQCNYVKLQALDYLMANVLIQDKQKGYKSKNETVQKMLKGDKISSISMLDVVELQVEIGLN